jgi:hypothetical protein
MTMTDGGTPFVVVPFDSDCIMLSVGDQTAAISVLGVVKLSQLLARAAIEANPGVAIAALLPEGWCD